MMEVSEAVAAVLREASAFEPHAISLLDALGLVLAEDVRADADSPPFDKSLVDGFAVRLADCVASLPVIETVAAGQVPTRSLDRPAAIQIMTGAPLPVGAEAVVPVELTSEQIGASGGVHVSIPIKVASWKLDTNILRRSFYEARRLGGRGGIGTSAARIGSTRGVRSRSRDCSATTSSRRAGDRRRISPCRTSTGSGTDSELERDDALRTTSSSLRRTGAVGNCPRRTRSPARANRHRTAIRRASPFWRRLDGRERSRALRVGGRWSAAGFPQSERETRQADLVWSARSPAELTNFGLRPAGQSGQQFGLL